MEISEIIARHQNGGSNKDNNILQNLCHNYLHTLWHFDA